MSRSRRADFPFALPPGTTVKAINLDVLALAGGAETPAGVAVAKPKRQKYRAVKSEYKGRKYDSKAEAWRAAELDVMQAKGLIKWWHPKPGSFHLGCPENVVRPDFLVVGHDSVWIEEIKGFRTAKCKKDLRLWKAYGPCPMHVIGQSGTEIIIPNGYKR